jgi:hypothetical protein
METAVFRMTTTRVALLAAVLLIVETAHGQATASGKAIPAGDRTIAVAGAGVDLLTTALVHSKDSTESRMIQKSTEIVELTGDLTGRVLYQVTTEIDFVHKTLVNTGNQVYSGTVAGSAPVMLHDDRFRFEVNLATGEEQGHVYLVDHIAGPNVRCTLEAKGTGFSAQGNPTFTYRGECTIPNR